MDLRNQKRTSLNITQLHKELTKNKVITSSRPYLSELARDGKIPFTGEGRSKRFDYQAVVDALGSIRVRVEPAANAKNLDHFPPLKEGQTKEDYEREVRAKLGDDPSLTDTKIFLTIYQGKLAEQKFDIEAKRLVYRDDVEQMAFSVVRVLRDQILAIPERLAGEVASSNDPREIKEIMYKEINQVLDYLSSEKVLYE